MTPLAIIEQISYVRDIMKSISSFLPRKCLHVATLANLTFPEVASLYRPINAFTLKCCYWEDCRIRRISSCSLRINISLLQQITKQKRAEVKTLATCEITVSMADWLMPNSDKWQYYAPSTVNSAVVCCHERMNMAETITSTHSLQHLSLLAFQNSNF